MKMSRKHMMIGTASLGLAGALATGGVALAASGPTGTGTPSSSVAENDFGCGLMAGFGDMRGGAFGDAPMLTTARHRRAIETAYAETTEFGRVWSGQRFPATVAAIHLRTAVIALEELIGTVEIENVLDRVFSSFCVGK